MKVRTLIKQLLHEDMNAEVHFKSPFTVLNGYFKIKGVLHSEHGQQKSVLLSSQKPQPKKRKYPRENKR